jgi:hypothetical protein
MRVISLNDHIWALGFQWCPRLSRTATRSDTLKRAQKEDPAYDLAAVTRRQVGFAASGGSPDAFEKTRALAAFMPKLSMLAMMCLRDTADTPFWWVYAWRNGAIVGDGDRCFDTREEAEAQMDNLRALMDFESEPVFATPEESEKALQPRLLVDLQAVIHRRGRIVPLTVSVTQRKKRMITMGICAALLACAGYGAHVFMVHRAEQAAIRDARLAKMSREARHRELKSHPDRYFPQKWKDAAPASEQASSCLQTMLGLPVIENGWTLTEARCAGKNVTVTWKHGTNADYLHLPDKAKLKTPKSAVSRIQFPFSVKPRKDDLYPHLLTRDEAQRILYQITQNTNSRLKLSFGHPATKTIDKVKLVAPWLKADWRLDRISGAFLKDAGFWKRLSGLPGLRLEVVDLKGDAWTIMGYIYVRTAK